MSKATANRAKTREGVKIELVHQNVLEKLARKHVESPNRPHCASGALLHF